MIIIEGVDRVVDGKQQLVYPSFWLPDISLRNIKIILTAASKASSLQSLIETRMNLVLSEKKVEEAKKNIYENYNILTQVFPEGKDGVSLAELKACCLILEGNQAFRGSI